MIMMRHYCFKFSTSTSFACPSRGRDALVWASRVIPGIFPTKVSRWSLKTFTEQLVDYTRVVVYFALTHIFHELLPQFRCGEWRFMSWGSFSLCAAFSSTPAPTMGPQDIRGPRCESLYSKLEQCALVNHPCAFSSFCFSWGREPFGLN